MAVKPIPEGLNARCEGCSRRVARADAVPKQGLRVDEFLMMLKRGRFIRLNQERGEAS